MILTFCGTGSAFNHKHGNTSALLEWDNTNLLLDCGHTVPNRISKIIPLNKINNIWISHLHADHSGGLEEIVFQNYFLHNKRKLNLYIKKELYPYLEQQLLYNLKYNHYKICNLDDYFNIFLINDAFIINNTLFQIDKTEHVNGSLAYILHGPRFIYTGDSQFIDWSQYNLQNIQYIFQDCQLTKHGNDTHTTLEDLTKLPINITKKIYCMHYGENINSYKDIIKQHGMRISRSYRKIKL